MEILTMKNNRIVLLFILLVPLSIFLGSARAGAAQRAGTDGPIATFQVTRDSLTWTPLQSFAGMLLEIVFPNGSVERLEFGTGQAATIAVSSSERTLPDGTYTYQLTAFPQIDEIALKTLASIQDSPDRQQIIEELKAAGQLPSSLAAMTGAFTVQGGAFLVGGEDRGEEEPDPPPGDQLFDILHLDDVIIDGSLCVGLDCVDGEVWGFDTQRLKENNLRIHFDDTSSTASFPANDWRVVINDTANGGDSYFAVEDATAGRQVVRVQAGAPSNSLYIDSGGDVGIGTNSPALDLQIRTGDTPSVRLEQDGSSGWPPQTWDMAGNETNFFIRDATNGSLLPFKIKPSAPHNSLFIAANGNIGLGTSSPSEALEVAGNPSVLGDGNVLVDGYVTELSSVDAKENFSAVDSQAVLEALSEMPIQTWSYRSESNQIVHMGPTAQDFYAAFELGQDEHHIASIDSSGVALAAIQGLQANLTDSQSEIEALKAQNTALENRLARLEAAQGAGNPQTGVHLLTLAMQATLLAGLFLAGLLAGKKWKGAAQHVD